MPFSDAPDGCFSRAITCSVFELLRPPAVFTASFARKDRGGGFSRGVSFWMLFQMRRTPVLRSVNLATPHGPWQFVPDRNQACGRPIRRECRKFFFVFELRESVRQRFLIPQEADGDVVVRINRKGWHRGFSPSVRRAQAFVSRRVHSSLLGPEESSRICANSQKHQEMFGPISAAGIWDQMAGGPSVEKGCTGVLA